MIWPSGRTTLNLHQYALSAEELFNKVLKFAFLMFGNDCNCGKSHSFSEALCGARAIKSDYNSLTTTKFRYLFRQGIAVLDKFDESQMEDEQAEALGI